MLVNLQDPKHVYIVCGKTDLRIVMVCLLMSTLNKAMEKNPGVHPMLHSDRGFQYTSSQFAKLTAKYGITRSMSRVGKCIDNAPMESLGLEYDKTNISKGDWFSLPIVKYIMNIISKLNSTENKEINGNFLLIQLWSSLNGYINLLSYDAIPYNSNYIKQTIEKFI